MNEAFSKLFSLKGKDIWVFGDTGYLGQAVVILLQPMGAKVLCVDAGNHATATMKHSQNLIGKEIMRIVSWNGNENVKPLASKPVRLRIYLKDADLYSFRFK